MKFFRVKFTIIELLMVITIIAILASLLLPALKNAKVTAQRMECAGNMKSAYSAIKYYADDYNEYIVAYLMLYDYNPYNRIWMQHLSYLGLGYPQGKISIVKEMYPYMCRAVNRDFFLTGSSGGYFSWAFNLYCARVYHDNITDWSDMKNFRNIKTPSRTLFVADTSDTANSNSFLYALSLYSDPNSSTARARLATRHGGKTANILFFDGHVNTGFKPADAPLNSNDAFWQGK